MVGLTTIKNYWETGSCKFNAIFKMLMRHDFRNNKLGLENNDATFIEI